MNLCFIQFLSKIQFKCNGDNRKEREKCKYYREEVVIAGSRCAFYDFQKISCSCQEAQRDSIEKLKEHLEEKYEDFKC